MYPEWRISSSIKHYYLSGHRPGRWLLSRVLRPMRWGEIPRMFSMVPTRRAHSLERRLQCSETGRERIVQVSFHPTPSRPSIVCPNASISTPAAETSTLAQPHCHFEDPLVYPDLDLTNGGGLRPAWSKVSTTGRVQKQAIVPNVLPDPSLSLYLAAACAPLPANEGTVAWDTSARAAEDAALRMPKLGQAGCGRERPPRVGNFFWLDPNFRRLRCCAARTS